MFLSSLIRYCRKYIRYRASLSELSALDERTLADIGLKRSEIMAVAWDNVRR